MNGMTPQSDGALLAFPTTPSTEWGRKYEFLGWILFCKKREKETCGATSYSRNSIGGSGIGWTE
jgi:hypothetical protein